ncbi:hypothetical protein [Pedobacter sp. Leaf176]|uniref:hypothetical protein n=1 Tax=Pedobacter sp. Leaf176 TaxID=1736286 RepID=UPI0006FF8A61|nr:hypothetical protein [Pedobacter sp. Leaf176]KQR70909.1 hypothetical protein ASF92_05740 [Pedobacter sp. Leaf176]
MKINILAALFLLLALTGCKEFFEPSLEGRRISLLAPADKLESNVYKQSFWWEGNEDAFAYRLQVVSGRFDSVAALVLDTLIYTDKFSYTLEPGKYQWRVRGENGSSHTDYFLRSLIINPSSLNGQSLQLTAPGNTFVSSDATIRYEWLKLFGASRYRLQIDTNGFTDSTKLVLNTLTEQLSFTNTLKKQGQYEFRARAENDSQLSKWSEVRHLIFDNNPPDKVILTVPANKQFVAKPVKLQWNALTDAEKYEVSVFKSDSLTLFAGYPLLSMSTSSNFDAGDANERIVWRVRAIDKAGNKGAFSSFFSFTLQ